jgi:hypothetical protein
LVNARGTERPNVRHRLAHVTSPLGAGYGDGVLAARFGFALFRAAANCANERSQTAADDC